MNQPAVIQTDKLTRTYSGGRGIHDLTLDVHRGEIFGCLGPNGSGKTTTIRLMINLIRPTHGHVHVLGMNPRSAGTKLRARIGFLPGELGLYENQTGEDLLGFLAALSRSRAPHQRWVCDQLQLSRADLRRKIRTYSKGMKQKLAIVQAIQHDPELLILDEPTGGLDPLIQNAFFDLLREFRKREKTIFLSTHVLSEVSAICDRVAVLVDGRLAMVKTVPDLLETADRKLWIKLPPTIDPEPAAAPALPGAQFLRVESGWAVYHVEAEDAPNMIDVLSQIRIVDFRFEAVLEDAFLKLYEEPSR